MHPSVASIYFCNKFLEKYDIPQTKESFQKVEELLRHSDLKNEDNRQNLINWIAKNWNIKFHLFNFNMENSNNSLPK